MAKCKKVSKKHLYQLTIIAYGWLRNQGINHALCLPETDWLKPESNDKEDASKAIFWSLSSVVKLKTLLFYCLWDPQCWTFSFQLCVGSGTRSGWWRRWTWGWSQCSLSWPLYKPNVIVLPEYQNCASHCAHFTEKTQQFHRKSKNLSKKSKEFHKRFPQRGGAFSSRAGRQVTRCISRVGYRG